MIKTALTAVALLTAATFTTATATMAQPVGAKGYVHKVAHYGPRFTPRMVRKTLRWRGYYNIAFTDRHLPVYQVRACKNGKRFKIGLNRWGKVIWRNKRGNCYGHYNKRRNRNRY